MKTLTVQQFLEMFPDDDACLSHLMKVRHGEILACPKCSKSGKFSRLTRVLAYSCPACGHHIHPMVGTPFAKSHVALQKWFYAMYLFTTTRHGVPAKELERQLGVSYPTAWRMGHEIRKFMAKIDGDDPLGGHIEIDEVIIGGKKPGVDRRRKDAAGKSVVMGMLERGGKLMTKVVPDIRRRTLLPLILKNVTKGSTISTDEMRSYAILPHFGYEHGVVRHTRKEYAVGKHHVNSLEGMWAIIKRSIRGTHVHVSSKHLWKYLGEFEFRYNMRESPELMIDRLLLSF